MRMIRLGIGAVILVAGTLSLASCFLFTTGLNQPNSMDVIVVRDSVSPKGPGGGPSPRAPQPRVSPASARIAFTRIWYPTQATLTAIMQNAANKRMGDFTAIADPASSASGCLQVLERTADNPYVFDLMDDDAWWTSGVLPVADTYYPGVIIEVLYYEFDINDFTIRWYLQADGTYEREDVLISTEASVLDGGTGGVFKFAYVQAADGVVVFHDTRQATGSGLNSVVIESKWDLWDDPVDPSGLLPASTHSVFHGDVAQIDEHNSIFFETGNAPAEINYVISYNLSTTYGGVEYDENVDADDSGTITFSDLIAVKGSGNFDLTPITGAIEYSF